MINHLKALSGHRDGATSIEYVLIAVLIALAIILAVTGVGSVVSTRYLTISNSVAAAT